MGSNPGQLRWRIPGTPSRARHGRRFARWPPSGTLGRTELPAQHAAGHAAAMRCRATPCQASQWGEPKCAARSGAGPSGRHGSGGASVTHRSGPPRPIGAVVRASQRLRAGRQDRSRVDANGGGRRTSVPRVCAGRPYSLVARQGRRTTKSADGGTPAPVPVSGPVESPALGPALNPAPAALPRQVGWSIGCRVECSLRCHIR